MPFGIQPIHIIIVAIVALLIFGPARLPEIGRGVGRAITEFRRGAKEMGGSFMEELNQPVDPNGEPQRAPDGVAAAVSADSSVPLASAPASEPAAREHPYHPRLLASRQHRETSASTAENPIPPGPYTATSAARKSPNNRCQITGRR